MKEDYENTVILCCLVYALYTIHGIKHGRICSDEVETYLDITCPTTPLLS